MEIYYKSEALYVHIDYDITFDTIAIMERRIFRLILDYGIDKIYIHINGNRDEELLRQFKKNYYHQFKGFLMIQ